MLMPLSFSSLSSPPSPAFLYAFCTSLLQKDFSFVLFDAQTLSRGATAENCQVDEKPQTLGEKPSLSLCPWSPSSASHITTDITPMAILSALLGWLLCCKLWKCLRSLLNQAPIYQILCQPHVIDQDGKNLESPYWLWWPWDLTQYSAALTPPEVYHDRKGLPCSG